MDKIDDTLIEVGIESRSVEGNDLVPLLFDMKMTRQMMDHAIDAIERRLKAK